MGGFKSEVEGGGGFFVRWISSKLPRVFRENPCVNGGFTSKFPLLRD